MYFSFSKIQSSPDIVKCFHLTQQEARSNANIFQKPIQKRKEKRRRIEKKKKPSTSSNCWKFSSSVQGWNYIWVAIQNHIYRFSFFNHSLPFLPYDKQLIMWKLCIIGIYSWLNILERIELGVNVVLGSKVKIIKVPGNSQHSRMLGLFSHHRSQNNFCHLRKK